jgi:hypothetical protein
MPTSTQLKGTFGGKGAQVQARNTAADLRAEERAGRLLRDAQIKTGSFFTVDINCVFSTATSPAQFASEWIDFGNMRFTADPGICDGSKWQAQEGAPALDKEASNYDPAVHLSFPLLAQLLKTKTDDRGMVSAAKVLIFAIGAVPEGFKAKASITFVGPVILKG